MNEESLVHTIGPNPQDTSFQPRILISLQGGRKVGR